MKKVMCKTKCFLIAMLLAGLVFSSVFSFNMDALASTIPTTTQGKQKVVLAAGTKYATDLYVINSGKPGPVMMVVGGMHGDGTAGVKAAHKLIDSSIESGVLLVLPEANKPAVQLSQRTVPGGADLNRIFPKTAAELPGDILARAIYNTVKQYKVNWIIDMHEGTNFSKVTSGATGQSLIYYPSSTTTPIVEKIAASINNGISNTKEQFSLLKYPVKGSLARASAEFLGVNSFIFETCNKQNESVRINNHVKAANSLMIELGLKKAPIQETRQKVVLARGTKYATDLYIIDSGKPGPTVMVVGGIHGNEIAGYQAANKVKEYSIKKGKLLVLPEANKLAIDINRRAATGQSDLNRAFPTTSKGQPDNTLSKAIYDAVKKYKVDWLMDMHEGFDYYANSATNSVGQTIIHYPSTEMTRMANKMITEVNKSNSTKTRFTLLKYPAKGSLARSTGEFLGVNSFIMESCMKQTLSTRINNQLKALNTILIELKMK